MHIEKDDVSSPNVLIVTDLRDIYVEIHVWRAGKRSLKKEREKELSKMSM